MKYLIAGLGNPGFQYKETRHNIGFMILDKFVNIHGSSFFSDKYVELAEVKYRGRKIILIKPNTYINLSGKAVNYWLQKLKISFENFLVINDDISLPTGSLRMRKKGSDGGHNGLKDINNVLGTNNYPRLRFGIGNDFNKGRQAEYVLSNFTNDEKTSINDRIKLAVKMIEYFTIIGINQTMSEFNSK